MGENHSRSAVILGSCILLGLALLGYLLGHAALQVKALDRVVSVKGLSEREVAADTVIWPIRFQDAGNDIPGLSDSIQSKSRLIADFLTEHGLKAEEVTAHPPAITDLQAQAYGDKKSAFRFTGMAAITVYSHNVEIVRRAMADVIALVKKGVAISGEDYEQKTEFLFTKLNDLKPVMIAEATQNARAVAEKFAADSQSRLGSIKSAAQGQFTIEDRDKTSPHVKKVRVVATVEYYLSD